MKRVISFILAIVMVFLTIPPVSFAAQAADFETELRNKGFTESYIPALIALHNAHPKWQFEALKVGESFSTAVANERKHGSKTPGHNQQRIQNYSGNNGKGYYCECSYCKKNGEYVVQEKPNWVSASEYAVSYYLDPRNFLNEEYIFQFESTAYNSAHTQTGVEYILSGTWMYNANITYKDANGNTLTYKNSSGNTVKYSQAIMEAAKNSKMSAYYLASKIVQEVGGTSATAGGASGTSTTYPGIYNYYNINAFTGAADGLKWAAVTGNSWVTNTTCRVRSGPSTDTTELVMLPSGTTVTYISTTEKQPDGYKWINVTVTYGGKTYNGYIREDLLTYKSTASYNRPWTNPYLSIYNGAQWIADNFKTQFTGYLQKFNVNPASGSSMHMNEYMTNVQGAASEAAKTYKAYKNANLLSESIVFTIPVYTDMPVGNLSTPKISSLSNEANGVKISWNTVAGAEKYRVLRKTGNGNWEKLNDTLSNTYVDTTVKSGTRYTYTVCCVSSDSKTVTSAYNEAGKSITYLSAPIISSISADNAGTIISWGKVTGAENYKVFRKVSGGSWTAIGTTTSTSFTDKTATKGTNYSYTVRCISKDGNSYTSGYNTVGKSFTAVSAPVISSLGNINTGVQINWGKVTGAEKYRVYRKTSSTGWVGITDTTSTSFVDTTAKSGTKYIYTVRCVTADGKTYASGYDATGKSITYLSAPQLISVNAETAGNLVKWNAVTGAENYRVFRKVGNGSWMAIGTTTSTSFTDKTAVKGTKYTYTVRCVTKNGSSYTSGYDTAGLSFASLATPVISSLANNNSGVQITWGKVAGGERYRVYRKTSSTGWVGVTDTTSTSFVDTTAKSGTKYIYTVRCVTADGKTFASGYDATGKSITYLSAPKLTSVNAEIAGTLIKWNAVTGAENYRVFRKVGNGSWMAIGTTTSTSFTDKTAVKGTKYTYTVRCVNKNGSSYTSAYDTVGLSFTALGTPSITSLSNETNGVKIVWGQISGAEKYRVYRKTSTTGWVGITDTTSTSFVDTTAKSGTKYTYTVRCVTADGKTYASGYDASGKSITYISAPNLTSVSASNEGVQIKWGAVTGAQNYKVFRKTENGGWTVIGTTAYTNFTDLTAIKGTTYSYTVRCVSKNGSSYTSSYDNTGKSVTAVATVSAKNDMVRVAETQLGNIGGKKFWSWAGYSSRVPWCNIFITWCANELGYYQKGRMPLYWDPRDTMAWFKERELYKNSSYVPKAGDLVFFDEPYMDRRPYHIGLVEKYENGMVYTIEGNSDDSVKRRSYEHNSPHIYGYATPDYGHN